MERNISPVKDLRSLFAVIKVINMVKPHLVNFGTPKMGLLGMIGAHELVFHYIILVGDSDMNTRKDLNDGSLKGWSGSQAFLLIRSFASVPQLKQ